jgi:hypothetical protein
MVVTRRGRKCRTAIGNDGTNVKLIGRHGLLKAKVPNMLAVLFQHETQLRCGLDPFCNYNQSQILHFFEQFHGPARLLKRRLSVICSSS